MIRILAGGLVVAMAAAIAAASLSPAEAAPPPQCKRYAANALWAQEQNLRWNCGFGGFRWHDRYDWHYGWCLTVSPWTVDAERAARNAQLATCKRQ